MSEIKAYVKENILNEDSSRVIGEWNGEEYEYYSTKEIDLEDLMVKYIQRVPNYDFQVEGYLIKDLNEFLKQEGIL